MSQPNLKTLISEHRLRARIEELGKQISKDYGDKEITVVCVLKGALLFTADLIRQIPNPLRLETIRISSYGNGTTSGEVNILNDALDVKGRNVLVIDDILDTGKTLSALVGKIRSQEPESLKVCVLLNKPDHRQIEFEADYVGFTIPNEFVIGYGLDLAENFRNLPYIGAK